jgi:hypothetical protein
MLKFSILCGSVCSMECLVGNQVLATVFGAAAVAFFLVGMVQEALKARRKLARALQGKE